MAKKTPEIEDLVKSPVGMSADDAEAVRREAGEKLSKNQLVKASGDGYDVFSESGKAHVSRDLNTTTCTCADYDGATTIGIKDYKCEHIYAVKHFTMFGETKVDTKVDAKVETKEEQVAEKQDIVFDGDNMEVVEETEEDNFIARLSKPLPRALIKTRDVTWGKKFVEYITWTTAADILDKIADSNWSFEIKQVLMGSSSVTVVSALTVFGVTRDGVGVNDVVGGKWEMAIKGAASDSLKRAAVMFGVARQLYEDDIPSEDTLKRAANFQGNVQGNVQGNNQQSGSPVATSLGDMVTAKQLGMIRAIGNEAGVDVDSETKTMFNCSLEELSKKAASDLISHLQTIQRGAAQRPQATQW